MKTLKITTDNKISIVDVDLCSSESIANAIGSEYIETVHTVELQNFFCGQAEMVVDEEGLLNSKDTNLFGCLFYGTIKHGTPIVGDLLLVEFDGFEDLIPLGNPEYWKKRLLEIFEFLEEEGKEQ